MWTRFMDMHSGGGLKEPFQYIYIEAPQDEAEVIFYNRFGHDPNHVTCRCCGNDYSIGEEEGTLEQASAFERDCRYDKTLNDYVEEPDPERSWHRYQTLEEWLNSEYSFVICAEDIKPEEREGSLPYNWDD